MFSYHSYNKCERLSFIKNMIKNSYVLLSLRYSLVSQQLLVKHRTPTSKCHCSSTSTDTFLSVCCLTCVDLGGVLLQLGVNPVRLLSFSSW